MRKAIILILLALFIVGCSSQQQPQAQDKATVASDETKEVVQANSPLMLLLDKQGEAPNIKYRYSKLPDLNTETVTIKDNKVKIDLISGIKIKEYSTIYIDTSTKEAFGLCEERKDVVCTNYGKVTVVNFDEFNPITPYAWLAKVPKVAEIKGSETISQRQTTVIEFGSEGQNIKIWIDNFYKIPLKVQVESGSDKDTYVYDLITMGNIKDSEVNSP
ncbi:MAG: hypothetical protein Q8L27_04600 [archaeon]|nr:hypothetical protein [archaeon]